MFAEAVVIPPARAVITHARKKGIDAQGRAIYETLDQQVTHNLILNGGRVALHTYIYGTSTQRTSAGLGAGFNYVAISNDASAAASGDTALTGELTANGLGRAQGTVVLPTGSGNETVITHVFTYTGSTPQGVQKAALFDAASGGKMIHEVTFTQRTLFEDDTITIQYTIQAG